MKNDLAIKCNIAVDRESLQRFASKAAVWTRQLSPKLWGSTPLGSWVFFLFKTVNLF